MRKKCIGADKIVNCCDILSEEWSLYYCKNNLELEDPSKFYYQIVNNHPTIINVELKGGILVCLEPSHRKEVPDKVFYEAQRIVKSKELEYGKDTILIAYQGDVTVRILPTLTRPSEPIPSVAELQENIHKRLYSVNLANNIVWDTRTGRHICTLKVLRKSEITFLYGD